MTVNSFFAFRVAIQDVNDNAPILEMPTTCVNVSEFHEINDHIAIIKAKDLDDPTTPNGQVTFRIKNGNDFGKCF